MKRGRHHIIYVEDEDNDVLLLQRALNKAGWNCVMTVFDACDATIEHLGKAAADGHFPDLVLVDLKLIESSGFELLEWLAKCPSRGLARVVVYSSSTMPEFVRRAQSLGVDRYLEKPNEFDDLIAICRELKDLTGQDKSSPSEPPGPIPMSCAKAPGQDRPRV